MNKNETRLFEIQRLKKAYNSLGIQANTMAETLEYMKKIEELENEETEILKRCDAI